MLSIKCVRPTPVQEVYCVITNMPDETPPHGQRRMRTARLEAFSDGVFAIAITLLVLEIAAPVGSGDDLLGAFLNQWPSYPAYVVSFSTIGALWLGHSLITEHLEQADAILVRLELAAGRLVSALPPRDCSLSISVRTMPSASR